MRKSFELCPYLDNESYELSRAGGSDMCNSYLWCKHEEKYLKEEFLSLSNC